MTGEGKMKDESIVSVFADALAKIQSVKLATSENKPVWYNSQVRLMVGDRTIITTQFQDVTWKAKYKTGQYPESTKTYYTSRLIRLTPPLAGQGAMSFEQFVTEKEFTHNLRGKWWSRVITELLGEEYLSIFLKERMTNMVIARMSGLDPEKEVVK
jgi:hypothetical protein